MVVVALLAVLSAELTESRKLSQAAGRPAGLHSCGLIRTTAASHAYTQPAIAAGYDESAARVYAQDVMSNNIPAAAHGLESATGKQCAVPCIWPA